MADERARDETVGVQTGDWGAFGKLRTTGTNNIERRWTAPKDEHTWRGERETWLFAFLDCGRGLWKVIGVKEEEVWADRLANANESAALRLMCSWVLCFLPSGCWRSLIRKKNIYIKGEYDSSVQETDEKQTDSDICLEKEFLSSNILPPHILLNGQTLCLMNWEYSLWH